MNMKQVAEFASRNMEYVETDPTGRYGRFGEVLGKGAMKTVYKAIDEVMGIEVAWSQVNLKQVLRSSVDLQRLYSEVHLLSTLDHNSIIRFHTSWIDVHRHTFNFITELFTSGTLREYRRKYMRIDIRAIKSWARQILEGLVYLHSHDPPVIHRDLKCDNIFVNGHLGQVKIGDLGLARILHGSRSAHSVIGTPEFMAPELYEEDYNELVDVYSFGMCVLEMITSEFPYSECINPAQIYKKVTAGKLPGAFYRVDDFEAQRFIGKCLVSASKRVSAKELLLDPFLVSNESWMVCKRKPFLNENEMERLKLQDDDDDFPRTKMTITGKLNSEDNTIFLKVQIADTDGRARNVYFPFDIVNDTPIDVAVEMVKELEITDWEPFEIAKVINGEIASLVPGWKKWDLPHQEAYHYSFGYQPDEENDDDECISHHYYPSSHSSSQLSFSGSMMPRGLQDWLQDELPDETHSQSSSSHSGSYSNLNYFSGDEHTFEVGPERRDSYPVTTRTHNLTRFCPEESSHLGHNHNLATRNVNYRHSKNSLPGLNASANSRNRKLFSESRRLTRNRSLVDVQSQLLHRSLVEEVRKRRLFKTVGDVETVGFQSPYECRGQTSSRTWKPRNARH